MKNLVNILKAISDETRLRIINLLFERELCVCDIMETLQITQTKASRHLIYLKNAGLVMDRKQAQWTYYSMTKDEQMKFIDTLVHENLRSLGLYQKDLTNLGKWLGKKNIQCD